MANSTTNQNPIVLDTTAASYQLAESIQVYMAAYVKGALAGDDALIVGNGSNTYIHLTQNAATGTVSVLFPGGYTISKQDTLNVTIDSGTLYLYHR